MRYGDWDILLFPRDGKVPLKEFKVACHMVRDPDFSNNQLSIGLPTLCCFVPSLSPGSSFQVSVHSWSTPTPSQFTKTYTKHSDAHVFEARVFVDGRVVAYTTFDKDGSWPNVLEHSLDVSKSGDLGLLTFPNFCDELLQQNFWSPADDLGRIKVVISEAIARSATSIPYERVNNIVAFSFQHAPLGILEASSIAWPNPAMWRLTPFAESATTSSYVCHDIDSHAHSPRRKKSSQQHSHSRFVAPEQLAAQTAAAKGLQKHLAGNLAPFSKSLNSDPFVDGNSCFGSLSSAKMRQSANIAAPDIPIRANNTRQGRQSSTDTSMPDYVSAHGYNTNSESEPAGLGTDAELDGEAERNKMKVPTNTPISQQQVHFEPDDIAFAGSAYPLIPRGIHAPFDFANSLTDSLLNQPLSVHSPARSLQFSEHHQPNLFQFSHCLNTSIQDQPPPEYDPSGRQETPSDRVGPAPQKQSNSASSNPSLERGVKRLRGIITTPSKTGHAGDSAETGMRSVSCQAIGGEK